MRGGELFIKGSPYSVVCLLTIMAEAQTKQHRNSRSDDGKVGDDICRLQGSGLTNFVSVAGCFVLLCSLPSEIASWVELA